MAMSAVFRNVVYPLWHCVKRDGVNKAIAEADRNQWLPTSRLLEIQQQKLRSLFSFVSQYVPYYREMLRDLGYQSGQLISSEYLSKVPPLKKSDIRDRPRDLIREDQASDILLNNSTSGSTGEALRFYTDWRSRKYRKASVLRGDSWTGWQLGDRLVRLWGAPIDERLARGLGGRLHGWVTGDRFLSSFDLSQSKMDEYIREILRFRPVLLVAYPGPLEQMALHCRERGVSFPSLKAIISSAETLWPYQRETIEDAFRVKIFDRYGSREVGHIGSECEAHNGLHINVDRLLLEVVDEAGRPAKPGEVGRLLITDLENFGMPLIRYDIGDRGGWAESTQCPCGRGLPRLQKLEGRTMDIVRAPNGRQLGGTFWTLLLKSRPGLWQIQVIQEELSGIIINFVPDADFEPSVLEHFRDRIQEYCGSNFDVTFVEKKSIDLTGSGKRRLIVSEIPNRSQKS
jgi:phenylacetate-CoA ligase